jgi:hypothetical protein
MAQWGHSRGDYGALLEPFVTSNCRAGNALLTVDLGRPESAFGTLNWTLDELFERLLAPGIGGYIRELAIPDDTSAKSDEC